jgi:two-component system LytT family response regulator
MLRAIIIDDEQSSISTLKVLIEKHTPALRIVATTTEPEKGISLVKDYAPNIVFLDVSMPRMNGFDFLTQVEDKNFRLVFTTAHAEYAIKAIKNQAYDYLLKPIDIDELKTCVNKIVNEKSTLDQKTKLIEHKNIVIPVRDGTIFVKSQDVIRLEASGSYTFFYLENNIKHLVSKNLKESEQLLDANYFYRCHASHIVNLNKVVKMSSHDGLFAQMTDGSKPEIARKNKEVFLEKLKLI